MSTFPLYKDKRRKIGIGGEVAENHHHHHHLSLEEEDEIGAEAGEVVHFSDNNHNSHTTETNTIRMEVEYNLHQGGLGGQQQQQQQQQGEGSSSEPPFNSINNGRRRRRRRNQPEIPWFVKPLSKCCFCCRFEDDDDDDEDTDNNKPIIATGCSTDMYARATVFMASIFLGPALLQLASNQAQAQQQQQQQGEGGENNDDIGGNTARVYGFKPSSLLSNIAIVGGLISTMILPIFGAIVDHTPYRRHVGLWTAFVLTMIKLVETIFLKSNWFLVANLQICSLICYYTHTVATYAYSAELSSIPTKQSQYQTYFFTSMFISMILYMFEVLIPGILYGWDDVQTGTFACAVTTITCIPLFYICWKYLFNDCPPIQQHGIPSGQSLLTTGFTKLQKTHKYINQYLPHVNVFLGTMMFSEAANAALATIATTYMKEFLNMNAIEIGIAMLVVLIFGLPGTWIGHAICHKYNNPVTSTKICLIVYIISTALACMTLKPMYKNLIYVYCSFFGICQGWIHPQHTTIFVTITTTAATATATATATAETNNCPTDTTMTDTSSMMEDELEGEEEKEEENQQLESTTTNNNNNHDHHHGSVLVPSHHHHHQKQGVAELMGVFLFCCQILSFLPPLVFTFLNELGMSMQIGMGSLVPFFIVGYWGLIRMGDYQMALESIVLRQQQQQIDDGDVIITNNGNYYCDTTTDRLPNSATCSNTNNDGSNQKKDDNDNYKNAGLQLGVFT